MAGNASVAKNSVGKAVKTSLGQSERSGSAGQYWDVAGAEG